MAITIISMMMGVQKLQMEFETGVEYFAGRQKRVVSHIKYFCQKGCAIIYTSARYLVTFMK